MLNDYLFDVSQLSEYDSFREINFHRILLDGVMPHSHWLADDKSSLGILHRTNWAKTPTIPTSELFSYLVAGEPLWPSYESHFRKNLELGDNITTEMIMGWNPKIAEGLSRTIWFSNLYCCQCWTFMIYWMHNALNVIKHDTSAPKCHWCEIIVTTRY